MKHWHCENTGSHCGCTRGRHLEKHLLCEHVVVHVLILTAHAKHGLVQPREEPRCCSVRCQCLIAFILCSKRMPVRKPGRCIAGCKLCGLAKEAAGGVAVAGGEVVAPHGIPRHSRVCIVLYQPAIRFTALLFCLLAVHIDHSSRCARSMDCPRWQPVNGQLSSQRAHQEEYKWAQCLAL